MSGPATYYFTIDELDHERVVFKGPNNSALTIDRDVWDNSDCPLCIAVRIEGP